MAKDWKKVFQDHGAIWVHDGHPKRPFALLTSGLWSDGFVNCTLITQHPRIVAEALEDLAIPTERKIDWVIGSAMGAVTFAYAVGLKLGARAGFTEKDGEAMKLARFEIGKNETVLVVEDTISTGGSTLKTIEGIKAAGVPDANILPFIVCLVNRSGADTLGGREIKSLIKPIIKTWKPEDSTPAQKAAGAVRAKSNWADLTKAY
jgi:orotate phosphoribosyltransferase